MRVRDVSVAVLFDLDEALYPYREYKLSGFRAVAEYVQRRYTDSDRFYDALYATVEEHGLSYRHSFDDAIEIVGSDRVTVGELLSVYRHHDPDIELPETSERVLVETKDVADMVGIVTEGDRTMQRRKIAALGLEPLVDEVAITNDKTDTDAFERVVEPHGIAPSDAVYIGDDPSKDFDRPTALDMVTIRVRTGMHADASTGDSAPTHDVSTLSAILDIITQKT